MRGLAAFPPTRIHRDHIGLETTEIFESQTKRASTLVGRLNADNQEREQRFSKPVQLSSLLSLYNQNHDNVFKAFSKRQ